MNKINWKLRVKNKATLAALLAACVTLVYTVLGMAGVVPAVSQSAVMEALAMLLNILVLLGIVVDPTTPGINDSARAMGYAELGGGKEG